MILHLRSRIDKVLKYEPLIYSLVFQTVNFFSKEPRFFNLSMQLSKVYRISSRLEIKVRCDESRRSADRMEREESEEKRAKEKGVRSVVAF